MCGSLRFTLKPFEDVPLAACAQELHVQLRRDEVDHGGDPAMEHQPKAVCGCTTRAKGRHCIAQLRTLHEPVSKEGGSLLEGTE